MKDSLTDFYRGWLVKISPSEQGFKAICYSPSRRQLVIPQYYASDLDALFNAKQTIDYRVACHALSVTLRELYEVGNLNFEDWSALQRSLTVIQQGK